MTKIIQLLLLATVVISACKNVDNSTDQLITDSNIISNKIFHFNSVDYYSRTKNRSTERAFYKSEFTEKGESPMDIFTGYKPDQLADSTFITQLKDMGYQKAIIVEESAIKEISESMVSGTFPDPKLVTTCAPLFRDILILRQNGKISGVAKLCYDCGKFHLVGNDSDSSLRDVVYFGRIGKAINRKKKLIIDP